MNIQNNGLNLNNIAFSGHKKFTDKTGYEKHKFYYLYDKDKYDCELELYNIKRDRNGNLTIVEKGTPAKTIKMDSGMIEQDMTEVDGINPNLGFAYRFKLTDKKTKQSAYAFDNGTVIGIFNNKTANQYNVVLNNRAVINKNGPMQLIMPDLYYPGIDSAVSPSEALRGAALTTLDKDKRAAALNSVRTHANKLGGNFYGIIERLPEISKQEGVKRIVGTPYTKDSISSHKYWTENAYQISPDFGTEEDFRVFQRELFKNDINWVADAALVNEGFGGIHMAELLRKGENSVSKNMFRTGEYISLGILPDKSTHTNMKIINAPVIVNEQKEVVKNPEYDSKKPTYIQFYDDRLVSEQQRNSQSPSDLITYDNKNTDNIYDITHHDDAVYPFPIEVSPKELENNIRRTAKENGGKVDLSDIGTIKQVANFSTFNVENKSEAGGIELWDGNVDIAKLMFYPSLKDDERFVKLPQYERAEAEADFNRGALAVREYAVNSGKYWTKLCADELLDYTSGLFNSRYNTPQEYLDAIKELARKGALPASAVQNIDKEVLENVFNNDYRSIIIDETPDLSVNDYALMRAMDVPFETLPVAVNLLGILTSPYIAKRPNNESELGVSRYETYTAGNPNLPEKYAKTYKETESFYANSIVPLINEMLSGVVTAEGNLDVSERDKYILTLAIPELTKFVLIKSLAPNADIKIDESGYIDFSNVNPEEITMQSLGIPYNSMTSEEEAQTVLSAMKKGIQSITADDINKINKGLKNRFNNKSLIDFKIAEMITDRTEAGMGWRIDAAKDIAAMDSVRAGIDSMPQQWDNVIDFWKKYNQEILKINPHSYTTAEITDLAGLFAGQDKTKYKSDGDAERKFIEETGITTVANYNYFFSLLPEMFSHSSFETGASNWMPKEAKNFFLREKLDTGWCHDDENNPGFLFQSPDDGVANSYTFIGNHDKPRVLHCLALDMGLYYSDFKNEDAQNKAKECLGENLEKVFKNDYAKVKPAAIAMGTRINQSIDSVVTDEKLKKSLKSAVSNLSAGIHKGRHFDAEAFGTRPFEIAIKSVFDEAGYNGADRAKLEAKMLENILTPAMDRYLSMYKILTVLPGSPTDFAGDKEGATGFETKAKNYHQQNRNVIRWEWLNNPEYTFINKFYKDMNEIAQLRNNPKLSALNDGATVAVPIISGARKDEKTGKIEYSNNEKMQAMLRYNDKGSIVLTLHDLTGADSDITSKMVRKRTKTSVKPDSIYDKIVFSAENMNVKQGLKNGISVGTKFKNANPSDKNTYEIAKIKVDGKEYYYLKGLDEQGKEIPITITPEDLNTMILYKV